MCYCSADDAWHCARNDSPIDEDRSCLCLCHTIAIDAALPAGTIELRNSHQTVRILVDLPAGAHRATLYSTLQGAESEPTRPARISRKEQIDGDK